MHIQRQHWKRVLVSVGAAGLAIWLVAAAVRAHSFDWRLVLDSLARLRWKWLAVATIPVFGTYLGRALRWSVFLRPLRPRPSLPRLLEATILGFTAITLFGRPGEVVRPYLIARNEGVPVSSQLAAWVLERLFDLLMALLAFAFALTRIEASAAHPGPRLSQVLETGGRAAGVAGCLVLAMLLFLRHLADPVRRRLLAALGHLSEHRFRRIEGIVEAVVEGVRSTRSDAAMAAVFLYSLLEWFLIWSCYWCISRAFSGLARLGLVDVLMLMGLVSFGCVVQIPGVGGGMQVAAVLVLTEMFHVGVELAGSFALVLWIFTFVAVVPVGLLLGVRAGLNWRGLRGLSRPEAVQ